VNVDDYFDMRNLRPKTINGGCPVSGCTAMLGKVGNQRREFPLCPMHRLRIHPKTFVYYNGPDKESKRDAALRNILFERDYFRGHILGNAAKAETHRICNENSEDALTWNVFTGLARFASLSRLLSTFTQSSVQGEPELYLWGLRVQLDNSSAPELFPALRGARGYFEKGIKKFLTEPDVMLYVPGQWLILVEAKFTGPNTIAKTDPSEDVDGEKPKSREGILRRYPSSALPPGSLLPFSYEGPFYGQLYRNLVFAVYMANELKVKWALINLVCEGQARQSAAFEDPTPFIHALLPEETRRRFMFTSWEMIYRNNVVKNPKLKKLAKYMYDKSAFERRALAVELKSTK
jgi:hypothetical protein